MDLVLLGEEGRANAVYGRISPSLRKVTQPDHSARSMIEIYLVVESALLVEEVEELGVRLASPEVEVTDLKVAPDWDRYMPNVNSVAWASTMMNTYSGSCCRSRPRHQK